MTWRVKLFFFPCSCVHCTHEICRHREERTDLLGRKIKGIYVGMQEKVGLFFFYIFMTQCLDSPFSWFVHDGKSWETEWTLGRKKILLSIPQECLYVIRLVCPPVCLSVCPSVCFHDNSRTISRRMMKLCTIIVEVKSNMEFEDGSRAWPLTRPNWRFS